jgi:hypothetical protein
MTDDTKKFNMLHHDDNGELLHAEVVDVSIRDWGTTASLPNLDMRHGDTITLSPKPERAPLPVEEAEQEETVG